MSDTDIVKGMSTRLLVEGRPVEAGWTGLRGAWLPQDAPHLRVAFFAGANHLFSLLMGMADEDPPTEAGLARSEMMMEAIEIELDEFIQVFELKNFPAEGSA